MRAEQQLRPLNLGEILDVGIKIYMRNALTLFKIVAVVVVPVQFLSVIITLSALPDFFNSAFSGTPPDPDETETFAEDPSQLWTLFAGIGIVILLSFLSSTLATGASFKAVGTAYLGGVPEWRSSLTFVAQRLHSVLWVSFLSTLFMLLGIVACIVPGVWLYASYAVVLPALLTEDARGMEALRRSFHLVKGRWWPTFGLLVLSVIMAGIVGQIIGLIATGLTFTPVGDSFVATLVLNALASTVASVLTTPVVAAIVSVLYFDLRVRKEGFDLQLLAQRIGATATGPSLAPAGPVWGPPGRPGEGGQDPAPLAPEHQPPYWPPPPGWQPPPLPGDDQPPR